MGLISVVAVAKCCSQQRTFIGDSRSFSAVACTQGKSHTKHAALMARDTVAHLLVIQEAPAARGAVLALAKLCSQSHWHRRHLLALDMCVAAAAGDAAACNSLIGDFLDANEALDRDQDSHLKAGLKLKLQRNSVDIHLAQFAGHSSGATAPTFTAVVGAVAGAHTPKSAAFDPKVIHHILQYRSDFLAVPFATVASVGIHVEQAIEQDIQNQCRSVTFAV